MNRLILFAAAACLAACNKPTDLDEVVGDQAPAAETPKVQAAETSKEHVQPQGSPVRGHISSVGV